jgi:radical SAM protein with 4Fe4S-binding SPASM domain
MKIIRILKKTVTRKGREEIRDAFIQRTTLKFAKMLDGWMPYGPGFIGIEPTAQCNLRCKICPRSYWNPNIKTGNMSKEVFNKIIPYISKRVTISPQMFGEPLLAPHFFDMLHILKKRSRSIVINTNCTLFTPKNCKKLVKEGIDIIGLSIDGIETLKSIRGVSIDTITKNIENLNQAKRELRSDKPHLGIAFVGMKLNIYELPMIIEFAKKYGIEGVEVVHLVVYSKNLLDENLLMHKKFASNYFSLAQKKAKELGIGLSLPSLKEEEKLCTQPFYSLWINWNGDVRPCCASTVHEKNSIVIGNINNSSLRKLWNHRKMRRLRLELLGLFSLNKYCKKCPMRDIRIENFNRILKMK